MFIYFITALILSWFLIKRFILERLSVEMKGRWVFITGCDSGFGRLLSLHLLSKGVNVFSGCFTDRGREELERVASELEGMEGSEGEGEGARGEIVTLSLDVTSDQSIDDAYQVVSKTLQAKDASLWGIVNNAGIFSIFGPDDWCSIKHYKDSLDVNCLGAVRVCHKFLPLIKHSKGRVVTMGSSAGRLHGQYVGPYCTAKFAVEAYMDCLRFELRPFGVSVHILEPGAFKTDLLSEEAQNARIDNLWNTLPPQVKEEYGDTFKDNFKQAWNMGVNVVANPNLQWVIDHYTHALFSRWPRLRYYTGYDSMLLFIPMSLLPTSAQDRILSIMYSLQPGPTLVPQSLLPHKPQLLPSK